MITVDYKDRTPIYEQVIKSIENLIAMGVFEQDDKLPSVRQLAIDLSINPNTIQKAYTKLEDMGLIYTVKGVGKFISKSNHETKKNKLNSYFKNIESDVLQAKKFGLDSEQFEDWIEQLRRIFNDNCN
ncbi:MAG: GntR family transcriptional regulator [Clostridia bacterium]